jgi:hypothetical protein
MKHPYFIKFLTIAFLGPILNLSGFHSLSYFWTLPLGSTYFSVLLSLSLSETRGSFLQESLIPFGQWGHFTPIFSGARLVLREILWGSPAPNLHPQYSPFWAQSLSVQHLSVLWSRHCSCSDPCFSCLFLLCHLQGQTLPSLGWVDRKNWFSLSTYHSRSFCPMYDWISAFATPKAKIWLLFFPPKYQSCPQAMDVSKSLNGKRTQFEKECLKRKHIS